jgi:hypothetical protein
LGTALDPLHRRTKYHLIYLTGHPTGIVEFMDTSERVDLVQARVRAVKKVDAREKKSGVADMFAMSIVEEASDGRSSADEVDAFWRRYLAIGDRRITTMPRR